MTQTIKLAVGGRLLDRLLAAAESDEVSASEAIRRILWRHFEARQEAEPGPVGPEEGRGAALASSSLPTPLPSPPRRGFHPETNPETQAPALEDSLSSGSTGRVREAPAGASAAGGGSVCLLAPSGAFGGSRSLRDPRSHEAAAGGPGALPLAAAQAPPEPPPVLRLPCRASRPGDASTWGLSPGQVERWQAVFPGLDVLGEARKAGAWLEANPGRWKTPRGIVRFLFSWLERANDGGRSARRDAAGRGGGGGWKPALDRPAPPPRGSLKEAYGRDSFEEWEAELRAGVAEPEELAKCLRDLAEIRRRWEARHGA